MNAQIEHAKEKGYKVLVVCLPISWDFVPSGFFRSWINVFTPAVYAHLEKIKVMSVVTVNSYYPLPYNRCRSIDEAIDTYGADYIMTLDADMTYPKDLVGLMLHGLGGEYKVKVGLYWKRGDGCITVPARFTKWEQEKEFESWIREYGYVTPSGEQCIMSQPVMNYEENIPFEVDTAGTGCMICTSDIFSKIKKPYFKHTPSPRYGDKVYECVGSDTYFFSQLKKAGIKVLCDPRIKCGHITSYEVTEKDFFRNRASNKLDNFGFDVREEQKRSISKWLTL